jgi:hypothetical protein
VREHDRERIKKSDLILVGKRERKIALGRYGRRILQWIVVKIRSRG